MGRHHDSERVMRAITPVPPAARPARFASFPSDIMERSFQLWSTTGRSGARVERLLAGEQGPEVAVPSAATINRWAMEHGWAGRADGEVLTTRGRSLAQLRAGLLAAVLLGKDTLLEGMTGGLDALAPSEAATRLKAAELALRTAERSGLLALVAGAPDAPDETVDTRDLSLGERARIQRARIVAGNAEN